MTRVNFLDLFDFLDQKLESLIYLADFSLTKFFLKGRVLEVEVILGFLEANGAYCDCEVLFNVAERFEEWQEASQKTFFWEACSSHLFVHLRRVIYSSLTGNLHFEN